MYVFMMDHPFVVVGLVIIAAVLFGTAWYKFLTHLMDERPDSTLDDDTEVR